MSLIKRLFVFSLVITTVLSFNPFNVQAAGEYGAGSLLALEGVDGAAVYYIGSDDKKYVFPEGKTYATWYDDFNAVVRVDVAELDMYDDGGAMTYRAGTKLVTHENTAKIYAIGPGGMLHWLPTAEVAEALYGEMWYMMVQDVIPGYFSSSYVSGADLSDMYPSGTLLQIGTDMYYVDGSDVRPFADSDAFDANNFSYDNVLEVDDVAAYGSGESITGEETGLAGFMPAEGTNDDDDPVAAGELSVSLASDTPAAAYTYMNSTHVPFTKVKLTAGSDPVTVTSMVLERTGGPASDAAFTGVNVLLGDYTLLSSAYKALNSDHQATVTDDFVVPANSSVYLTLTAKINDSTSYAGEAPSLSLVSIATTATVSGSLPITGNQMSANGTVDVADITVTENPNLSALTESVGVEDVEFINVKIASDGITSDDIRIDSIRFNNVGSADGTDLDNLELVVDNEVVATSEMIANYVTFDLASCGADCVIEDGKNETFQLRGDIIGGSGRTFDFDVKKVDDIFAYDVLNNVYITPDAAVDAGRIVTVSRGKIAVSKTNVVPTKNIAEDTSDIEFGSWNFKVTGEPITISTIGINIDVTGTVESADFTSLKLVDADGVVLTAGINGSAGAGDGSATSTDSFTLPVGDNAVKLIGNLNDDADNNDTVQFAIDMSSTGSTNWDATGDVTGDSITISGGYATPQAEVDANLITIRDISLEVTTLPTPAATTIAGGTIDHLYTKVRFDASDSSEDMRVTAFEFYLAASATAKTNEINNITFVVDGTELSVTKNGSGTTAGADEEISVVLSGADQFKVPSSGYVDMYIYADLSAGATAGGSHTLDITSGNSNAVTAEGWTSGTSASPAESAAAGAAMTVGTAGGTVVVSLASDSPGGALMSSGTEVELAKFKFLATTTENVELDYLYLTQVITDTNSSSYKDYDQIWFEDEAGVLVPGTMTTPTSTMPKVNFADDAFVVDYTDTNGVVLTLKADLSSQSVNGVSDHYLGYKINANADVVAKGEATGTGSVEYISSGSAPTGKTHYVYKGYPIFSRTNLTANLTNGTNDLFEFTVSAVNSDIALYGFTFDITTTSATVTELYLYDKTGTERVVNTTVGTPTASVYTWQVVGSDFDATEWPSDDITVSSGGTRTFVVRGNATGVASGSSVSMRMGGDSAHVTANGDSLMHTASEVDGDTHDDFIWSDLNVGAHTVSTDDWTNGYLVSGLPSSSSTSQVTAL
jgi:hypothetical protein